MLKDANPSDAFIGLNLLRGARSRAQEFALLRPRGPEALVDLGGEMLASPWGASLVRELERGGWMERGAQEREAVSARGAHMLTPVEEGFPGLLRNVPDPPLALYVEGEFRPEDAHAIAIVGTRTASRYGRRMAERIAGEVAARGLTVVSGLARGIDGIAHRAALDAGGRTVAVLGCGLDHQYPREHGELRAAIARSGAVLSELPPDVPPRPQNFPRRNRLISGLALGVLVVEATEKSGALITARHALEQGRDVLAVPGNADFPKSRGTNGLIKQGAQLVETADDVIETLREDVRQSLRAPRPRGEEEALSEPERQVLAFLEEGEKPIDQLIEELRRPAGEVAGYLLQLELKGRVRQHPGQVFARS
ncbi:MAG: DNA-processing protein DprA [Nitrospinota bacterium]